MVVSKLVGVTERAAPAPGRAWDLINACVGEQLPSELTFDSHARFLLPPSVSGCEVARHPVPDPPVGHEIQSACQLALAPGCCLQDWSLWLSFELAHKSCRNGEVALMDHGQADRPCPTHPVVVGQFACKRKSTTRILRDVPGVEDWNFEEVPSCRGSSQWTTRMRGQQVWVRRRGRQQHRRGRRERTCAGVQCAVRRKVKHDAWMDDLF